MRAGTTFSTDFAPALPGLLAEWSTLIGRDHSRYSALIGGMLVCCYGGNMWGISDLEWTTLLGGDWGTESRSCEEDWRSSRVEIYFY